MYICIYKFSDIIIVFGDNKYYFFKYIFSSSMYFTEKDSIIYIISIFLRNILQFFMMIKQIIFTKNMKTFKSLETIMLFFNTRFILKVHLDHIE